MTPLGPSVMSTLADAYRERARAALPTASAAVDADLPSLDPMAAALLARDLMRGDPDSFKAGYTRPNAVLAAEEAFRTVERPDIENTLDSLFVAEREEDAWPHFWARHIGGDLHRQNGLKVGRLEFEDDVPPSGTLDYEGRTVAFTVTREADGRELRITVEEVTMEERA